VCVCVFVFVCVCVFARGCLLTHTYADKWYIKHKYMHANTHT